MEMAVPEKSICDPNYPGAFNIVYISGPMSGYKDFNFDSFDKARDEAIALGWWVISPPDVDRYVGNPYVSANESYAKRDCDFINDLYVFQDALALLPGWERSKGSKTELCLAIWKGLQILNADDFEPFSKEEVDAMDWDAVVDELKKGILNAYQFKAEG